MKNYLKVLLVVVMVSILATSAVSAGFWDITGFSIFDKIRERMGGGQTAPAVGEPQIAINCDDSLSMCQTVRDGCRDDLDDCDDLLDTCLAEGCKEIEILTQGVLEIFDGTEITLVNLGSSSIVINVDGLEEIITLGSTEVVNGREITVYEIGVSSAVIALNCVNVVCEEIECPDCTESAQVYYDAYYCSDGVGIGDWDINVIVGDNGFLVENPEEYGASDRIYLTDGVNERTYSFELDESFDASDVIAGASSLDAVHIETDFQNGLGDFGSDNVWLYFNGDMGNSINPAAILDPNEYFVDVFYLNSTNNQIVWAGVYGIDQVIVDLGPDLTIHGLSNHEMVLKFDELTMVWSVNAMGVASLGELPNTEEKCELALDF